MSTFILVHGAGDSAFHWHLLEPELRARGHESVSVDLPCDDDSAGLVDYADAVIEGSSETEIFYNDVPDDVARAAIEHSRRQSDAPGREPWPLEAWPEVPTRFLLCREDRMFPAGWMREVVRARLGIVADEIDSGHCPALSRPGELAEQLDGYVKERLPA